MNVAVIPARGGSKRIANKNIRPFLGKPVIQYSIDAAMASDLFQHVIVSTDCPEITRVAKELGASVPFQRPVELSDDFTPTRPVVQHAIEQLSELLHSNSANDKAANQQSESEPRVSDCWNVCCLYATAPFVQIKDLQDSLDRLVDGNWDYVFPVTTFAFPIYRSLQFEEDSNVESGQGNLGLGNLGLGNLKPGKLKMTYPEHELTRSQDLPEVYHDAGQFYWGTGRSWRQCPRIYSANSTGHIIPRFRVQDLDTAEDWERAEAMYRAISATS